MDVRGYASKLLKQIEPVNDLIKDRENVVCSNTAINYMDNWKKFEDRYTLSKNHNHANPFLESESGIPESHIDAATAYQNLRKSYEQIIKHVQQTWLIPWRHYFVKCYTKKLLYLNTTTTQRAESAHRAFKTQLGFSTGDLCTILNSIELLLENQLDDLRQKLSSAKNIIAHQHRIPIFRKFTNDVPAYGLWRVYSQYQKFLKSLEPNGQPLGICTGVFEMTMGLPCSHRIKELHLSGQVLQAEDLHPHWRYPKPIMLCLPANDESRTYITPDDVDSHSALDPSVLTDDPASQLQDEELDEGLSVEEPSIVRGKGRPKRSVNKRQKTFDNSTRREPSLFVIDQVSLTETIRVTSSQILQGSLSQPSRSTS
ncbi:hypothetical protein K3495_g5334 [Podosphaera aphanis]|nr:hypothetical protein K3495_g5334 [Podosphaera aphanis]